MNGLGALNSIIHNSQFGWQLIQLISLTNTIAFFERSESIWFHY